MNRDERIARLERTVLKLTNACQLLNERLDGQAAMMKDLAKLVDLALSEPEPEPTTIAELLLLPAPDPEPDAGA